METVECYAQCQTPGVPLGSNLAKSRIGLAMVCALRPPEMPGDDRSILQAILH